MPEDADRPPNTDLEEPDAGKPPAVLFGMPPEPARAQRNRSVASAEGDADLLRRLLADQRAATLQARAQTVDLEKQLTALRAELAKALQGSPAPEAAETPRPQLRHDAVLIKVQWERAQKDLQRAKIAHQRESAQATAKLATVTEALRVASDEKARHSHSLTRKSKMWIAGSLGTTGGVIALVIAGICFASYLPRVKPSAPALAPAEIPTSAPLASTPGARSPMGSKLVVEERPKATGHSPQSEFSQGVARLSQAFDRFPGVDPETIMRAVNARDTTPGVQPCAFIWNDGQPELQFGEGSGNVSLAGTLTRCAEAVERFR